MNSNGTGKKLSKINIITDSEATLKHEMRLSLKHHESRTSQGANFMMVDPNFKMYYKVPVESVGEVMDCLNDWYNNGVASYMYEFPDVCKDSKNQQPVSGLHFEFKFESKKKEPIAFEKVAQTFIRILFKEIIQMSLEIPEDDEGHSCFLFNSEPSFDKRTQLYISKFRIVVPSIMTSPRVRFGIYDRLYNSVAIKKDFEKKLGVAFRTCFQVSMRLAPVPLIGSGDYELGEPLKLQDQLVIAGMDGDIYTNSINKIPNLVYAASINFQDPNGFIKKRVFYPTKSFEADLERRLVGDKRLIYREEYDKARAQFIIEMAKSNPTSQHQVASYQQLYDWLKILHADRFNTIEQWREILRCLAFHGDYYRCVAIIITRERAKLFADMDVFNENWQEAKNIKYHNKYTPSAIKHWGTCDYPDQMTNYTKECVTNKILHSIVHPFLTGRLGDNEFAECMKIMFSNEMLTVDCMGAKIPFSWYEFVTSHSSDIKHGQMYKWRAVGTEPDRLMNSISSDLVGIAEDILWELKHLQQYYSLEETKDESKAKSLITLIKRFIDNNHSLSKYACKQHIVKSSVAKFKNNVFMENLDQVENILGVGNGVLEFQGADVKFIDHYHNYPISLYTETNYVPYNPKRPEVIVVMDVLKSLVPKGEEDALEFLLCYFSTALDWYPKESLFFIIHGGGCHAIDTPIRMFDGSIQLVQNVNVGDRIMGDDNTQRVVQELFRGRDDMVEIIPKKGESFVVNKNHVLSLKVPGEDVLDIKVMDFMKLSAKRQRSASLYKSDGTECGFRIRPIGVGDYYGFELDGNHRYLTGDHFVHHNSNGKSFLMELFNRTLGPAYAKKIPLSVITDMSRGKSGGANSAFMQFKNARMASYSESNKNEVVNISTIKDLTGGEMQAGREIYKEQENFRVNCCQIVTTNHCFHLPTTEHAVWRRFISYRFKIRFVPKNPIGTYDRLGDRVLTEKIKAEKKYHEAFLSILVHYHTILYEKYNGNILHVPHPTIERETEEYRLSQDIYQKFIMQNMFYSKNTEDHQLTTLANNFRAFCNLEVGGPTNESTEYIISTFKNSELLMKHIIDVNGVLYLRNIYSMEPGGGTVIPNSIAFREWMKQDTGCAPTESSAHKVEDDYDDMADVFDEDE